MTAPRERDPETLYVTDAELIRRSGVPERLMRMRLRALDDDKRSGFPQKQKFWGNRRYWPDVKAYFDRVSGGFPQEARTATIRDTRAIDPTGHRPYSTRHQQGQ